MTDYSRITTILLNESAELISSYILEKFNNDYDRQMKKAEKYLLLKGTGYKHNYTSQGIICTHNELMVLTEEENK